MLYRYLVCWRQQAAAPPAHSRCESSWGRPAWTRGSAHGRSCPPRRSQRGIPAVFGSRTWHRHVAPIFAIKNGIPAIAGLRNGFPLIFGIKRSLKFLNIWDQREGFLQCLGSRVEFLQYLGSRTEFLQYLGSTGGIPAITRIKVFLLYLVSSVAFLKIFGINVRHPAICWEYEHVTFLKNSVLDAWHPIYIRFGRFGVAVPELLEVDPPPVLGTAFNSTRTRTGRTQRA